MILEILRYFDWTWPVTAVVAYLTYLAVDLYIKRRKLPPGPLPLPILGNLLVFFSKENIDLKVEKWRKQYGEVFTIWVGMEPTVVVCGWDRIKEALITMKNAFSGRRQRLSGSLFLEGHHDVLFTDYGGVWETLRKIIALAIRKYSVSDHLPILVDDVVKQVVPEMLARKEPVDVNDYLYLMLYNIIASTVFGKRYTMDDEEFLRLKAANDRINDEIGLGDLMDVYPSLKNHVMRNKYNKTRSLVRQFKIPVEEQYKLHKETYTQGEIRDFTDACLAAKEEAEAEDKDSAAYFTDGNMVMLILDVFAAGTDTTRITMTWILLYLCRYPEIQDRIRKEVLENIGAEIPKQEDRHKCPYTLAVIAETLRTRPVISFALEHKATKDAELAGYQIPKDTSVMIHIKSQHMDAAYYKDPEAFKPERFLEENGTFMTTTRFTGYLPFSLGRRACPGEKLALADLFLILTGLLQKCKFSYPGGADKADLEPQNLFSLNLPKPFKCIVEKV